MSEPVLSPIGVKKKKSPWKIVKSVLKVAFTLVFICALAASAQVIYTYQLYEPFYVSGESMWPTLNYDSRYFDGEGSSETIDPSSGDYSKPGTYLCDYGLMDSKPGFLEKIERFDIVVAYSTVPEYGSDGQLTNNPSEVIKRVIGMPGDAFYFETKNQAKLGTLYVKEKGEDEFTEVAQPFYDSSLHPEWSQQDIANVDFAKSTGTVYRNNSHELFPYLGSPTYTLADDEYFLCGDNRAHSGDSRSKGPFKASQMVGRAVAIVGQASYTVKANDSPSYKVSALYMPWDYVWLID